MINLIIMESAIWQFNFVGHFVLYSTHNAVFLGHANNIHCMAKAINSLAGALFTIHGTGDVYERLKEFLAVRSIIFIYSLTLTTKTRNRMVFKIGIHNFLSCDDSFSDFSFHRYTATTHLISQNLI